MGQNRHLVELCRLLIEKFLRCEESTREVKFLESRVSGVIELQRHTQELVVRPTEWMAWTYRETLARTVNLPDRVRSHAQ